MTNQEHFDRSVAVLVKAFLEGTLERMSCAACACGNLIAAASNLTIVSSGRGFAGHTRYLWKELGMDPFGGSDPHGIWDKYRFSSPTDEALLANTGYSKEQLTEIEAAFMGFGGYPSWTDNFTGLLRVVDVLADIHGIDLTTATAAKALFVRA